MDAWQTVASLLSGGLVGFVLGLIGGGGSILATPLLLYVVGVAPPHVAIGTGALAVSANAYANFITHARRRNVCWRCAIVFALVGTLGALAGSSLGKAIDGQQLLFLFGLVMVVVGAAMLRPRRERAPEHEVTTLRNCLRAGALALLAGAASGFFGIGGGFLIVPALILATGMSMGNAVGSSLLAVGTFGLATAINYAASGLVDWGIAGLFILGGVFGGVLGTRLSLRWGQRRALLTRIFAGFVFAVAGYILYRSGTALSG
ncbi:sulfite exporter TauE/SafE family protein [Stenotrophomonas sp. NLF4-10]|uniref:sulfite exporter TauE/SafE family protein n=1 Tax=Stenotrophomonas sp. NLF4-10 TaxID=2918754 RepID=UPI001EFA323D|nr:sulfite exporter TauE/SafE family protein [Stenotrophomonas sp. NLF4-10]MCG8277469.1 sulfite exporter TauE/SafE family protein [Stenotrophomonas sp. NLF4-10]